jgi:hypothetical protein
MLIPAVNPQQAGLVAASADMNAYSAAAAFLCSPPMVQAFAHASNQSLTGSALTAVTWATPLRDNDSTWSALSPAQVTLQTQGFYEVAAHIGVTVAAVTAECFIRLTTGASNPAGAGNITDWWHCSGVALAATTFALGSAGLIPVLIYPGDTLKLIVQPANTCTTASLLTGWWGDWHHRMVST